MSTKLVALAALLSISEASPTYNELFEQNQYLAKRNAVLEAKLQASDSSQIGPNSSVLLLHEATGQVSEVALASEEAISAFRHTTTPVPTVVVNGVKMQAKVYRLGKMGFVCTIVGMVWLVPMGLCKRFMQAKMYKFFWLLVMISFVIICVGFNMIHGLRFNDAFFFLVFFVAKMIDAVKNVLVGILALFVMFTLWKFKDRIFEALGIENPALFLGECRDWVTCWSMRRFSTLELFVLKVEGLPSMKLTSGNDVYVEVNWGYNVTSRTRVHPRAGANCVFKETLQFNWDPFDTETRMTITVKNQDIIGGSDIAYVQLGAQQVRNLEEPFSVAPVTPHSAASAGTARTGRSIGWGSTAGGNEVWSRDRFKTIDLIPAGTIWLRFGPVNDDDY